MSIFHKIVMFCLGLAAALPVMPADTAAPSPEALPKTLKNANQLLAAKKLTEAEAAFHEAEALSGGPCGECLLGLGGVRGLEGKWDEAAELTRRSLPLLTQPSSLARANNQLALAYASKNQLPDAEQAARKAVDYGGAWGEAARRNLAQILFLEKRWEDVVPVAREALARAGTDRAAADTSRILLCNARSHLSESGPPEPAPDWGQLKEKLNPPEVTRPVKISGPIPVYTNDAKAHNVQGVVILDSVIDEEGCVRHLRVDRAPLWTERSGPRHGAAMGVQSGCLRGEAGQSLLYLDRQLQDFRPVGSQPVPTRPPHPPKKGGLF